MKDELNRNIENPEELEKLYRNDKRGFNASFRELFPEGFTTELQRFWDVRLRYEFPQALKESAPKLGEGIIIFILSAILWLLIRVPIEGIDNEALGIFKYYTNVIPYLFIGGMSLYILIARGWATNQNIIKLFAITIGFITYSYILTEFKVGDYEDGFGFFGRGISGDSGGPQSVIMAILHMGFLLWFSYSLAFSNYEWKNWRGRFDYITYNADLGIIASIVHICIMIVMGITMGLFFTIRAEDFVEFFTKNVLTFMYIASPFLATYIYRKYPVVGTKIVPILANIFSVVVLGVLAVFLLAFPFSDNNPFEQREFLMMLNVIQIAAMAIIFFGLTGVVRKLEATSKFSAAVLFWLSIATTIINAIAFASISYRLFNYGYSYFKFTATIGNALFLVNMVLITRRIYALVFRDEDPEKLEKTIADYLIVYAIWSAIVVFILPWVL